MKTTLRIFLTLALLLSLCLTTFAADFTPSVEAKPAPEIVEYKFDGNPVAALFVDENGNVLDGVPSYNPDASDDIMELVLVSYADILNGASSDKGISDAVLPGVSEGILSAIEQIQAVSTVAELSEGLGEQIQAKIDEFFGDSAEKINLDEVDVSDVFDASVIMNKAEILHTLNGRKIRFRLKPNNFKKGDFFILLHNTEGKEWRVENDTYWENEDTLVITTDRLSAFAFVVEKQPDLSVDPDGPQSPQTGNAVNSNFLYVGISAVCILAAGYFFVKAAKKAKAE